MLMSDVSFNYPYLKIAANFWNIKYICMYAQFINREQPIPRRNGLCQEIRHVPLPRLGHHATAEYRALRGRDLVGHRHQRLLPRFRLELSEPGDFPEAR